MRGDSPQCPTRAISNRTGAWWTGEKTHLGFAHQKLIKQEQNLLQKSERVFHRNTKQLARILVFPWLREMVMEAGGKLHSAQ